VRRVPGLAGEADSGGMSAEMLTGIP
jgi:hypothetical protein